MFGKHVIFKPTSFSLSRFGHNMLLQDFRIISVHEQVEVITV